MKIILFDGECHLCNKSIQFVIKRDSKSAFHFCSLQSNYGKALLQKYHLEVSGDTFVFIDKDKAYMKSTAALKVCKQLDGFYPCLIVFKIVPTFLRDYIYDIVAKNRYTWFGKEETCMIPTKELKKRFLD